MKNEILKLREEGKTYNEIKKILNCSKSTISYYCGNGQKEKVRNRTKKRRKNILIAKLERFKYRKFISLREGIRKFNKRDNNFDSYFNINKNIIPTFNTDDVINKFGIDTYCYLSGEKINLFVDNYHLDHKIPASRNGDNSLENLGITHETVNKMKSDLTPDELIEWCIKILKFNGYKIEKNT